MLAVWEQSVLWLLLGTGFSGGGYGMPVGRDQWVAGRIEGREGFMGELPSCLLLKLAGVEQDGKLMGMPII